MFPKRSRSSIQNDNKNNNRSSNNSSSNSNNNNTTTITTVTRQSTTTMAWDNNNSNNNNNNNNNNNERRPSPTITLSLRDGSLNGLLLSDSEDDSSNSYNRNSYRDYSERDLDSSSLSNFSSDRDHSSSNWGGSSSSNSNNSNYFLGSTDRFISVSRGIFFSILLVSAVVCAGVAFALYTSEETENFLRSFNAEAEELVLATNHNVDTAFAALGSLSTSTTSLVKRSWLSSALQTPPGFIEIPDTKHQMGLAKETIDALAIAYMPKVLNEDYDLWALYSQQHKDWISLNQPEQGRVSFVEPEITPYIWQWEDDDNEDNDNNDDNNNDNNNDNNDNDNDNDNSDSDSDNDSSESTNTKANATTNTPESLSSDATTTNSSSPLPNTRALRPTATAKKNGLRRPHDCSGTAERRRRSLQEEDSETGMDEGGDENDNDTADNDEPDDPPQIQVPSPRNESYFTPVWHLVPVPTINETHKEAPIINYNLMDRSVFRRAANFLMTKSKTPVFLDVCDQSAWFGIDDHKEVVQTVVTVPVFRDFTDNAPIAGFFAATIPWKTFFENNANQDSKEILVVMNNTCDEVFTVSISGSTIEILGEEDLHDPKYDYMAQEAPFAQAYNNQNQNQNQNQNKDEFESEFADGYNGDGGDICVYTMIIYPTAAYEATYRTNRPWISSVSFVMVFLCTSFAFILFDCLVTRRQAKLLNTALRQNAIVNSLFPKNVQEKLMEEAEKNLVEANKNKLKHKQNAAEKQRSSNSKRNSSSNLNSFLNEHGNSNEERVVPLDSKPIADFFPKTTIMFADISGFTAWSSTREPEAVFTLLETIYRAFDQIAKRRRVFKVEVVGDCYVAVCGLPNPRKDHFAVMCRFAQDCLSAMQVYTKELEVLLGPDTGELALRVGLHSGPVVAGVLRGEKSRFQLFGDTMNTASRMESTGVPNRIQLSETTAKLLIGQGREHWITKRQEKVRAKGKGEMTTYFLLSAASRAQSVRDELILVNQDKGDESSSGVKQAQKRNRVADWVVEMLGKLLKDIVARRKLLGTEPDHRSAIEKLENRTNGEVSDSQSNLTVIDEAVECLDVPASSVTRADLEANPAQLDEVVVNELRDYVYSVASMYRKHAFHNFEHASHVSMSCIKLLNRIASLEDHYEDADDVSYGICSDPLIPFAIVFSALIHDVDHTGAPNVQLVKERHPLSAFYKNKSVAEQNSIDVAWCLLMEPAYANLRFHIYTTIEEFKCFRQVVVNCVMATDIVDKDLIRARNQRWDLAFSDEYKKKTTTNNNNNSSSSSIDDDDDDDDDDDIYKKNTRVPSSRSLLRSEYKKKNNNSSDDDEDDDNYHYKKYTRVPSSRSLLRSESLREIKNRRATVVIDHLMQLSDVAHTMQHWHIYRRWNERFFEESYVAYAECRAEKNPADYWYEGELGFYDFYIIPLANKIKQCQVFGVSSDEYLSYALLNRQEWEERGREVVEDMAKKYEAIHNAGISRQLFGLEMEAKVTDDIEETKSGRN